ncbi:uncharacterized protein LOC127874773 [Dreissena polymorpha]|uniref:uncharacterized protein LOC127874773 n=1 Tax=Dreissena polymorpha TaxID=45954 RepID=UPI0022648A6A|nr:uncharacterized protein LOC127874773 [Dreissena polymorpha]
MLKENDDQHNSKVTNDVLQSTSSNPHNSVKLNCISSCGSHSGSKDDPFDSDVKKDNGIYSLAKNVDPLYSTVIKKKQISVTESSNVAFKDDYPYSVVDKKNKAKEKAWMTTVPPAPVCSISDLPPYSKVNKKKKENS